MSVSQVVSIPSLIGSLCSCTASGFVLTCYTLLPPQRHFRHALILNLMIADFFNSLNNSISGIAVLARNGRMLEAGAACNLNGWLGQFTVQTVDFSILAISIVVLVTIKRAQVVEPPSILQAALFCLTTWIPGTITSFVALGLNFYGPVSGNWCWIRPQLLLQRYLLGHGWRIAIFFVTICIYIVIYLSLRRMYGNSILVSTESRATGHSQGPGDSQFHLQSNSEDLELQNATGTIATEHISVVIHSDTGPLGAEHSECRYSSREMVTFAANTDSERLVEPTVEYHDDKRPSGLKKINTNGTRDRKRSNADQHTSSSDVATVRRRQIRRILLLNGYPVMYIVLWIPGILNRVLESVQGKTPLWLAGLQASTQFIGLANALTYGWNEGLRNQLVLAWRNRRMRIPGR